MEFRLAIPAFQEGQCRGSWPEGEFVGEIVGLAQIDAIDLAAVRDLIDDDLRVGDHLR